MYYIGICDDEKGTCSKLENLLYKYEDKKGINIDVNIWYTGENLCNDLIKGNVLDLLFLDIELISTDGIKVGDFIREKLDNTETIIVYISSKSSYAMELFKVQPLDFLIKPLTKDMIEEIMARSLKVYERKNQTFEYFTKGCYYKVIYKKIMYFCSDNKKIIIYCRDDQMKFNGKLREIVKQVPYNFIRIHQSYLVNLDYIEECSYELVKMCDGKLLNISKPFQKIVRQQILQFKWEKSE